MFEYTLLIVGVVSFVVWTYLTVQRGTRLDWCGGPSLHCEDFHETCSHGAIPNNKHGTDLMRMEKPVGEHWGH
jgi:hypothetical protein